MMETLLSIAGGTIFLPLAVAYLAALAVGLVFALRALNRGSHEHRDPVS